MWSKTLIAMKNLNDKVYVNGHQHVIVKIIKDKGAKTVKYEVNNLPDQFLESDFEEKPAEKMNFKKQKFAQKLIDHDQRAADSIIK